jgi:hypothetical protein
MRRYVVWSLLASFVILMIEIYANLFIGGENDCFYTNREDWAVIHACKSPCHQYILGYQGSLRQDHPCYLIYEQGNHLFLNMIDPDQPLFKPVLFVKSLDFIKTHIEKRKVLIHCNHGKSRSASIALLYLSKSAGVISQTNYGEATRDFLRLFPYYEPGRGIAIYLESHWNEF